MKKLLLPVATGCVFMASGCSSVMSHTGEYQGYYPGSKADVRMMKSNDTSWAMTPLLVLDLPFSAVMDTLLLPMDYYNRDNTGTLDSIKASEAHNLAISHGVDIDHVPPVTTAAN
ncbi:YceK/YidQ family lipoprotein [Rouxiella badensis]|uniref:YceK/YidQ family lipoprotein n=1 Tax=Rouxiella badensis TaxID=1646377 RepID=A0A1X0W9E6_9GAMM|nr:YceK/YidQ family lipoprotein [Rouxiella badensis]MCC3702927.1 YceK/YidQ family lipoprotein [Rouxiella badensis]MCC3720255.1 YceK/YidQ family lipoprotein [Rouxiella badensis]MCC3729918.1 YceK/YidQ family lipoprotein [Rouxiella badensis]MCC3733899.1 YceK/YidQ family lipoprotein [Rouxiella badensis]MCC3741405.1 YceK/YidQ family lipoprotein [Rouxiella badensis]